MTPTPENVLAVYRNADFAAFSEGMTWYDEAHNFAKSLDPVRFHRAAGVLAALSPLQHWDQNKRAAAKLYAQGGQVEWNGNANGIGLSNSVRKAVAIFHGEDALDVLRAPKTRAFYLTILDPTGDHSPVIDRHAFDIAIGERTDDKARQALGRKGEYARFASVYREAARRVGIGSAQLQAITWVAWRHALLQPSRG
jgi:hypothetical protein